MMSVKNLDIHPRYTSCLLKAKIYNVKQLLLISKFELSKKTELSDNVLSGILTEAGKSVYNVSPSSVWDILNKTSERLFQHWKFTTGCSLIDRQLKGGIVFPGITEISGESASGKTQFCMQLCFCVQNPIDHGGLGGGALYICTEDVFPNKRLYQMAQEFCRSTCLSSKDGKPTKYTDQIYIEHVSDLDGLWSLLDIRIHVLLSKHDVKLIVIDSIAALFRAEYDVVDLAKRAKMLAKFGRLLHDLGRKKNICVVCINQVSDNFDTLNIDKNDIDGSRNVIPALGLTWSYFATTRLLLSRTRWTTSMFPKNCIKLKISPSQDCVIRRMNVLHSSFVPPSKSYFIVDKTGVKDFLMSEQQ